MPAVAHRTRQAGTISAAVEAHGTDEFKLAEGHKNVSTMPETWHAASHIHIFFYPSGKA